MVQLGLGIDDAAEAANVGRSTIYEEIGRGNLRAVKVGRRSIILVEDLRKWLESRPAIIPRRNMQPEQHGQRNKHRQHGRGRRRGSIYPPHPGDGGAAPA
jgi:excisionase family DNA binding protein